LQPPGPRGTLKDVSNVVTRGIRVSVESRYLVEESSPPADHYVFAYTVTIANEGADTVQLKTRHWIITDGHGHVEEVKGPGVVGHQPVLKPGQAFRYTSGCVLKTPRGTMHGTYQMFREDGSQFDAEIAPFLLVAPGPEAKRWLN
jgi:ApaG protein